MMALLPVMTMAQVTNIENVPTNVPRTFQGFLGLFGTLINWLFTILLVVATLFFFMAAYLYISAQGDEGKIDKAKDILIYGIVGLAVAMLAQGVRFVVQQFVTGA